MNLLKKIMIEDWKAKLACLLMASALWYLIKQNLPQKGPDLDWPPAPTWNTLQHP